MDHGFVHFGNRTFSFEDEVSVELISAIKWKTVQILLIVNIVRRTSHETHGVEQAVDRDVIYFWVVELFDMFANTL